MLPEVLNKEPSQQHQPALQKIQSNKSRNVSLDVKPTEGHAMVGMENDSGQVKTPRYGVNHFSEETQLQSQCQSPSKVQGQVKQPNGPKNRFVMTAENLAMLQRESENASHSDTASEPEDRNVRKKEEKQQGKSDQHVREETKHRKNLSPASFENSCDTVCRKDMV